MAFLVAQSGRAAYDRAYVDDLHHGMAVASAFVAADCVAKGAGSAFQ